MADAKRPRPEIHDGMSVEELQTFAMSLAQQGAEPEAWRATFVEYMRRCREIEDDPDDKIAGFVYNSLRYAISTTREVERNRA